MTTHLTDVPSETDALYAEMVKDGPEGVSFDPSDRDHSGLTLLQSNSPACIKRTPDYVEGAEPGHWLLKDAGVRSGVEGIEAVPLGMSDVIYLEWLPDRAGFAARYPKLPEGAVRMNPGSRRQQFLLGSNIIEPTRETYWLIEGRPYLFSLNSTKHAFARQLQSHWTLQRVPGTDRVPPCYAHRYLLTSAPASNGLGSWFVPRFADLGLVSLAQYHTAKPLAAVIKRQQPVALPAETAAAASPRVVDMTSRQAPGVA